MNFHILTLFPEMIEHAAASSILGRAIKSESIKLNITNIRDFSANKHKRVDDYPYGGGAGMVIEAEPVFRAVSHAKEISGENSRVIYLTPQAEVLDQSKVEELAREDSLILLCGHYEGIDERVLEEVVTDYISIGDYVLTGGELPALVLMDAVSRFVPGVLSNEESSQFESIQDNLLEYPQYTRPRVWHEKEVPPVLLCGDHDRITSWRYEKSVERTAQRRPDLLMANRNVYVIYYGSENAERASEQICEEVSRYGTLLNYGRAKLQKQKRRFTSKDAVIFISDDAALSEPENIINIFRNVKAEDTSLFFAGDNSAFSNDGTEKMLFDSLTLSGFLPVQAYYCQMNSSDTDQQIAADAEISVISADIRHRISRLAKRV